MAATKDLLSTSFLQRRPFLFSPLTAHELSFPSKQRRAAVVRKRTKTPVVAAAITENMMKAVTKKPADGSEEMPVKLRVRAAVTVRRKMREGLKESIGSQLDAFSEKIGRNVCFELVSNDIDPSKSPKKKKQYFISFLFLFSNSP